MTERPYVVLSCAISLDGCLDSTGPERLVLSGAEDLDRVDAERAAADAILVGAGTVRRDDPRLLIRSAARRARRLAQGRPEHPLGVTITASGDLDPQARFFTRVGEDGPVPAAAAERLVYSPDPAVAALRGRLDGRAEVVAAGDPPQLGHVLADLAGRGVGRVMVEGGARLSTEFLTGGLVDELQLSVAPFFVGDPAAPRFAGPGRYPAGPGRPLTLAEARPVGDVVLLRYLAGPGDGPWTPGIGGVAVVSERIPDLSPGPDGRLNAADRHWLREAIGLSRRCPQSASAYCVGAVLVGRDGSVLATGFSREHDPRDHAEEAALAQVDPADPRLASATLYSSLEPCRFRASRPVPCAELIIGTGLRRVVIAWLEPPVLAPGRGAELLRDRGITVLEVPELAAEARAVNAAVLGGSARRED